MARRTGICRMRLRLCIRASRPRTAPRWWSASSSPLCRGGGGCGEGAIGFSSFAVLMYYTRIRQRRRQWTLEPAGRRHQALRRKSHSRPRAWVGCVVLALLACRVSSVLVGAAVVAIGAAAYAVSAPGRPASGS